MKEKSYLNNNDVGSGGGQNEAPTFRAYYVWSLLTTLAVLLAFIVRAAPASARSVLFAAGVVASYAVLFTLPVAGVLWAARFAKGKLGNACVAGAAVLLTTATQLFLWADYIVQGMFGFHINGFVVNLVTTPEGVNSMGADAGTARVYVLAAAACLAANAGMWILLTRARPGRLVAGVVTARVLKRAALAVVLMGAGERLTYGVGHIRAWSDVLGVAVAMPAYQPMTFRSMASKLGIQGTRQLSVDAPKATAALAYPLKPLQVETPAKPLNVVWLVCESLRADMLTPEIMPRTWAFAQESSRFTRHYSGGNGTRMGVFSLFYGMPGSYWFSCLRERRPPVLIDRLQALNYQLHLSTSAAFSYPEFDKTLFAHVPAAQMHAESDGEGWKSDRHHVARIKNWLANERGKQPFFLFHFFESSHARYYFPPESVIRTPYLEDFNYATTNVRRDIELIRNRYINAVHHLDSQLGEVIDALRAQGVLDNTVVLITGDHGEEFFEVANWGHNSTFVEQQVRVPLVVHMPGRAPEVIDHPTSHVDAVPTLLPLLGVKNPSEDYGTGENLFSNSERLLTFADWDRIAFSDGRYKGVFPLSASMQVGGTLTTADDKPVDEAKTRMRDQGASLARLMKMLNQFSKRP